MQRRHSHRKHSRRRSNKHKHRRHEHDFTLELPAFAATHSVPPRLPPPPLAAAAAAAVVVEPKKKVTLYDRALHLLQYAAMNVRAPLAALHATQTPIFIHGKRCESLDEYYEARKKLFYISYRKNFEKISKASKLTTDTGWGW